ncbi:MAG: 16S rRNA (adenine(1518)-N(6)/adenine(1519)-N(6))-dimethyltransferase RsmA [Candidatus Methylacidiphilales bacterium]|nr:16S rRNA (adenine(1518)-N(6)/adenine(1519)-N(6))-dimethyltransferase RsmA [Candidatus Methylacidiphilales bacterium]
MTLTEIKKILAERGLNPLKHFGQNFLFDQNLCRWIIAQLRTPAPGPILEIGPGLGALTGFLLAGGYHVHTLEIDRGLAAYLRERFGRQKSFSLVEGDALETLPQQGPFPVILGNLPYNISTPLVATLLMRDHLPQECLFTLQKEVGHRFAASPGTADYGAISILLQAYYQVEILKTLPGNVFFPEPDVHSVVVRFTLHNIPDLPKPDREPFYALLRKAFTQRRKKLRNTTGIESDRRPQELSVDEWIRLYKKIQDAG